jgi:type IV secretory pathway VirJ component
MWFRKCLAAVCLLSLSACLHAPAPPGPADGVREVNVPAKASTVVMVLSGDGGWWGDIDRKLAEQIAAERPDDAVVGFDTQAWFGKRRTQEETARHIAALADRYVKRTGAHQVALVGYSFGADVLPLVVNGMSAVERARLKALVLMALARGVDPQVTPLEQAGLVKATIDLTPEIAKLPKARVTCLYGEDETKRTGCTLPEMAGADVVEMPGGHHFAGDVNALASLVLTAIAKP